MGDKILIIVIVTCRTINTKATALTHIENHIILIITIVMLIQRNKDGNTKPKYKMMEDDDSFEEISTSFGISQRAINHLTEDYVMANDLMASNVEQIKSVVSLQNKMYRSHATAAQHCYINTAQLNRVLAFYKWTIFAMKDAHAEYQENSAATFDIA